MKNNLHFQFFEEKGKLFGLCNNTKRIICINDKLIYIKEKPVSKPTQNSEDEFERECGLLGKIGESKDKMYSLNKDIEEKKQPIKKDEIIIYFLKDPLYFKKFLQFVDVVCDIFLKQKKINGILKKHHYRQRIQHKLQLKALKMMMHRENVWTSLRLNEDGQIRED